MKYLLLTFLLLSGCSEVARPEYDVEKFVVDKKICIQTCMRYTFGMFHSEGQSWGTGSSSMNGLTQTQIFDRVKNECVQYYKDERCCRRPSDDYSVQVLSSTIHGYEYGACRKKTR